MLLKNKKYILLSVLCSAFARSSKITIGGLDNRNIPSYENTLGDSFYESSLARELEVCLKTKKQYSRLIILTDLLFGLPQKVKAVW